MERITGGSGMNAFVGTRTLESSDELQELFDRFKEGKLCFFLRWPHKVSGFCKTLPDDFPSPEGQVFDSQKELRWKQQGTGYNVLLLSTEGEYPNFDLVGKSWIFHDQEAYLYPPTETRFPKGLNDQVNGKKINVGQRYFTDPQTATVHFVALVAK